MACYSLAGQYRSYWHPFAQLLHQCLELTLPHHDLNLVPLVQSCCTQCTARCSCIATGRRFVLPLLMLRLLEPFQKLHSA